MPDRPHNHILRSLADADPQVFAALAHQLEPYPMHRGSMLTRPRTRAEFVYFVDSGVVALVAGTQNGSSVEVAITGAEGVAGMAHALGDKPLPYGVLVQLSGLAYRAPRAVLREHIMSCNVLHELLMAYSQTLIHQLAQSAVCNRFHTAVQRLARWLLLTAERANTNRFELTHEFVAQMVGAPRSVVSASASTLREKRIIDYRRGVLTIRNPGRLHKVACECFDVLSHTARNTSAS